jgi:bacillithiol biosynthesis cysteine-adding enzyme BshC
VDVSQSGGAFQRYVLERENPKKIENSIENFLSLHLARAFAYCMFHFEKSTLPLSDTRSFDQLILDYISNSEFLLPFYDFEDSSEGIKRRIESYQNPYLTRKNLKTILLKQYSLADIKEIPAKTGENINSLEDNKTFTVTTGHQLVLCGGPLYVFYKIISVINLCKNLSAEFPEYHFVPVYWMATEDHDIAEIDHISLNGVTVKWVSDYKGMAGKMPMTGVDDFLNEIFASAHSSDNTDKLISLLRSCYASSSNLADATRKFINALFGKYGVVIVDGNDKVFKENFKNVFEDELLNSSSFKIVNETSMQLSNKYSPRVNPREVNLFYTGDGFRERIIREKDKFLVNNTNISFGKSELRQELTEHPDRFSPNVLLRPLFQESILPNVAYAGGPAEISYWLQLKNLFHHFNIPMPVLILRCTGMIVEEHLAAKMNRLKLSIENIFSSTDELLRDFITGENHFSFESVREIISAQFDIISHDAANADTTLKPTVEAERQKFIASLKVLEDKIIRAKKKKNETEVNQIRKIKEKLFPGNSLQERIDTFIPYYLKWGESFIDSLISVLDPMDKSFSVLEEKKN